MGDNAFLFLPLAVLAVLGGRMPAAIMAYGIALTLSFRSGAIEPLGCLGLVLTAGSLWFATASGRKAQVVFGGAAIGLTLLLSDHHWPGFHNPVIFDHRRFSPDSAPYSMYFNFDKVSAGLFVYAFYLRGQTARLGWIASLRLVSKALIGLVGLLMPLALIVSFVRFDAKWPAESFLWCFGNITLVVFAEECIYRGLIFGSLKRLSDISLSSSHSFRWLTMPSRWRAMYSPHLAIFSSWLAIVLSSIAFGLSHYHGGITYILLATVAGLFYSYTYSRTGRIGSSMAVHFGLNAIHFFLFSYPALAPI